MFFEVDNPYAVSTTIGRRNLMNAGYIYMKSFI